MADMGGMYNEKSSQLPRPDECTDVTIFVVIFSGLRTQYRVGCVVSRNGNKVIWKPTDWVLPARSNCGRMRNHAMPGKQWATFGNHNSDINDGRNFKAGRCASQK